MRLLITLSIAGTLFFVTGGAMAQSLAGTWDHSQTDEVLTLSADGSCTIQSPQRSVRGRYGVQGNVLWIEIPDHGLVLRNTVQSLTDSKLILVRDGASPMVYQRRPEILAEAGGTRLERSHVGVYVAMIQFILGQPITDAEVRELQAQAVAEFRQNPGGFVQGTLSIAQSLVQFRALTDPLQIGLARQQLFAALYQSAQAVPEHQKPPFFRIIDKYVDVLAYDAQNQLVLTAQDVDGVLNLMAFNAALSGETVNLTPEMRQDFRAAIAQAFDQLPLEQRQILASGGLLWQLIEANWQRLDEAQQQQARVRHAPQHPGTTSFNDLWAQQQNFNIMQNMMLESHAASMNIIENIGGTGNYWEVIDY